MPNNLSGYDAFQVIRSVFDVTKNTLRVSIVDGSTGGGSFEVIISHVNDSIRLGDGTNFITSTTIGPKVGLDVNLINGLSLDVDAATGDNVAIGNTWKKLIEVASPGVTYIGYANPGTTTASGTWQIKRIVETGSVTSIEFADGNLNFDNVWNNRGSLSYS